MEHFDNESKLKSYLLLRKKKKPKERLCVLASKSTYYIFISNNTSREVKTFGNFVVSPKTNCILFLATSWDEDQDKSAYGQTMMGTVTKFI